MKSLQARFWDKVDIRGADDCWVWIAMKDRLGYGKFRIGSRKDNSQKMVSSHRMAHELSNGPILDGLHCLHKCDNRGCCNPSHLFLGTHQENMKDMVKKGRQTHLGAPKGSFNGASKITEEDVKEIRNEMMSQRKLSAKYNLSNQQISRIINYKSWKHI